MRSIVFLLSLAPMLLSAALIPQSGYSGRPGDGTCRDCHPAKSLVPEDSSLLLGLPEELEPEAVYPCTLVIRYAGLNLWSFELTAVDSTSCQAGSFLLCDSLQTLLDTLDGIFYLKNSIRGAFIGKPDSARWAFDYLTPPAGTGPVTFYWSNYMANRKQGKKYYIMENCRTVPLVESE